MKIIMAKKSCHLCAFRMNDNVGSCPFCAANLLQINDEALQASDSCNNTTSGEKFMLARTKQFRDKWIPMLEHVIANV